jgi:hypothetical protein
MLCLPPAGAHAQGASTEVSREQARAEWEWMRLRNPATNVIPPGIREREVQFAERTSVFKPAAAATQWNRRGPFNVGGRVRALAVDVSNEHVILAGGISGGMWRSSNLGVSWARVTAPGDIQTVSCVAQDTRASKRNIWYYGTGELTGNSTRDFGGLDPVRGNGIFKSIDGGITWNALPSTVSSTPQSFTSNFQYVNKIAIDPSNLAQDEVYAAAAGAILRSIDGGATWNVALGTADPTISNVAVYTDVAVTSTGMVYATLGAGLSQGIWSSADGVQWNNITPTGWPQTGYIMIGITPTNESIVYFFAYAPNTGLNSGILVKWDGTSWTDLTANLPNFGGTKSLNMQGGYNMVVKVAPQNANTIFLGDTNLWRSTDGFTSTTHLVQIGGYSADGQGNLYPNHHPDLHALSFLPSNPSVLFTGSDGGVSVTTDCLAENVTWDYLNNGLFTTQFYGASLDHTSTSPVIVGGAQDWGTFGTGTTNLSTPWNWFFQGDGGMSYVADNNEFIYGAAEQGDIWIGYTAPGGNLSSSALLTPSGGSNFRFVTPYIMDPNNNKIIYVGAGGSIWRNSDVTQVPLQNSSPTNINYTSMTGAAPPSGNVSAFGISKTPANILYYGTDGGRVYRVNGANSGNPPPVDVWTGKGFPSGAYVNCIAVDPQDAQKALAIFSNYEVKSIFSTTDGGTTWASVSGNLEEHPDGTGSGPSVRWATILHLSGGGAVSYFVGTSTGVYSTGSLQGDATVWTHESPDLIGNMVVDGVDSRETDNQVIAATHGGGIMSAFAAPVIQPPSNFAVSDVPNDQGHALHLTWTASPSESSGGVSWYRIFRSRSSVLTTPVPISQFSSIDSLNSWDAHYTILIDSVAAGVASYTDSLVYFRNTPYSYWLQATGPGGASKLVPLAAPTLVAEAPRAFLTASAYPNPFNASTVIDYRIPADSPVIVRIYNSAGQKVGERREGMMTAGSHSFVWNGAGLSSGLYFYTVRAGTGSAAGKMLLLK